MKNPRLPPQNSSGALAPWILPRTGLSHPNWTLDTSKYIICRRQVYLWVVVPRKRANKRIRYAFDQSTAWWLVGCGFYLVLESTCFWENWTGYTLFFSSSFSFFSIPFIIFALLVGYSHHCQIADKNPSKRWNGEFWGYRIGIGFVQRDFVLWVFVCSVNFSLFPATTPRATTPHRYLTATTPRATTPVQIHSS